VLLTVAAVSATTIYSATAFSVTVNKIQVGGG
jgi:hypothetical protein